MACEWLTLHERMLPNALNVSYRALLSIPLSRFLIKMFPTPERRMDGSRCDHMILIGRPFRLSKFIVSRALSAERECVWGGEGRRGLVKGTKRTTSGKESINERI